MSDKFTVEIISPNKSILKTESSEVIIPSYEGEIGILKNHIPLITFLRPGVIKILNEKDRIFYVEEGTVEFSDNNLLILTSTAKETKDLDKIKINDIIKETEKYILSYKIDTLKNLIN